ncbi:unnamed protein product [Auanema sp. JU1783]|nr:unnamed protein product [Auanema sp. JU1783]
MMKMTSPVRTSFDIFNEKQIQENVNLLSHVPRENATYVHLPSGTVVTRARLGGVDESPNINKIRRSLFRSADPFEEATPKNTTRNEAQKTNNDSGFSEKYRDNSFAYYNRLFLSDSSDSESFDFADDDDVMRDDGSDDDWVPLVQLKRKGAKLVERKINNPKVASRRLTKRKTEPTESCSPVVKVSRCSSSGTNAPSDVHKNKVTEDVSTSCMNQESLNNITNADAKSKDVEMISAKMKFADLVFQFHNNVKLKIESDCDDDMTDISEADPEEFE